MTHFRTRTGLLTALALTSVGCVVDREYAEPLDRGDYAFYEGLDFGEFGANLDLLGGRLRGDIGHLENLEADATELSGYDDGSYSDVQVIAQTERGAAMSWVEIQGGMAHPDFRPGFERTYTMNDDAYGDPSGLHVAVIHCAGDQPYEWSYDQPADEVDVRVEEGPTPDTLRVSFTTRTFVVDPFTGFRASTPSESTGEFTLRR